MRKLNREDLIHLLDRKIFHLIGETADDLNMETDEVRKLCGMIESHMGEWNCDYRKKEVLPKPTTELQRFVHMCDFLSSKKFLNVSFNGYNIKY